MELVKENHILCCKRWQNYQIEPIWEKKPETYTVKVTYLDGGNVKVDDQSITYTGQSVTVSADADVK